MQNRRNFFKQSFAGALILGAAPLISNSTAATTTDPVKPKAPKSQNPFNL